MSTLGTVVVHLRYSRATGRLLWAWIAREPISWEVRLARGQTLAIESPYATRRVLRLDRHVRVCLWRTPASRKLPV
jgi:hypothetical protein